MVPALTHSTAGSGFMSQTLRSGTTICSDAPSSMAMASATCPRGNPLPKRAHAHPLTPIPKCTRIAGRTAAPSQQKSPPPPPSRCSVCLFTTAAPPPLSAVSSLPIHHLPPPPPLSSTSPSVNVSPGNHRIECPCWRPIGDSAEQIQSYFLGGGLQLKSPDLVYNSDKRYRLQTQAMGTVMVNLGVITRNFEKYGVET